MSIVLNPKKLSPFLVENFILNLIAVEEEGEGEPLISQVWKWPYL